MNQPDILIIGVIYNTYPETLRYVESLAPVGPGKIVLILIDNSHKAKPPGFLQTLKKYGFVRYLESGRNLGYFGGARLGLQHHLTEHADLPPWVLVTNVDIVFTPQFFQQLNAFGHHDKLGVVAPSIISKKWNADYNPKIRARYPESKLRFYQFLYSSFVFHNLFLVAAYSKKWLLGRKRNKHSAFKNNVPEKMKIYAPHGSCMIFTNTYFHLGGTLDLPHFLFGEEVFVAETAARLNLDVIYDPEMVVYDYEHASTGFLITPKINRYNRQAIQSIRNCFYP